MSDYTGRISLRKTTEKKLPENFFEQVLDCELKLKRNFSILLLTELVAYYSVINLNKLECNRILRKH